MAILANGQIVEGMPVANVAPHGYCAKLNGKFPLSLSKCNKLAEHFRDSIARLGTHPSADGWKADLAALEIHIEQVKARNAERRKA